MNVPAPHYLLFSEAGCNDHAGRWRFVLRSDDGSEEFEAADVEPQVRGERLELLTVVRALEALDQPSRVTLASTSRYIRQGIQYGLSQWRNNGWRWEFFGEMVPVKNCDLWQRMDCALQFHRLECCRRRFDPPHSATVDKRVHNWARYGRILVYNKVAHVFVYFADVLARRAA